MSCEGGLHAWVRVSGNRQSVALPLPSQVGPRRRTGGKKERRWDTCARRARLWCDLARDSLTRPEKGGGGGRARYGCGRMVDIHAPTRYARRWLAITDKTHSVGYPYSSTATPGITARRRECRSAAICCGGQYINRPGPPTRGSATDNSFVHTTPDPTQRTWASLCAHLYPTFAATISFRDG